MNASERAQKGAGYAAVYAAETRMAEASNGQVPVRSHPGVAVRELTCAWAWQVPRAVPPMVDGIGASCGRVVLTYGGEA